MLERLKTDILILGSGGAGLFAALHAHQADPDARHHGRHQGPARQVRLHAHGAGRLQRRAQSRRLGRAPLHGHHRGRQVAARPGARLDAGDQGRRARARAGERDRLLLRPQSRRHAARQGLRRPDLRPHRAQGRPHRHRDHQPADGAGVGAADPAAGGAPRRRADPGQGRQVARRRADDRHPHRRVPLRRRPRPCCWRPAAGRPCTATTRRPATRAWTASPWRCGSGLPLRDMEMVQFHPTGPARRPRHAHDRHRAGGGPARRRRASAQRRACSASWATTTRKLERATRDVVSPRHLRGDARRAHHAARRRLHQDGPPRAGEGAPSSSRAWWSAAPTAASTSPAGWSRWCRRRTTSWAAWSAASTPRPSCRACSWPARMPAACTAPTGSAATASPTRPCSAASPARRCRAGSRPIRGHRAPDEDVLEAEMARAQHPFARKAGDLNALRETLLDAMWDDVGVLRDAAGLERGLARARRDRGASCWRPACRTATAPST